MSFTVIFILNISTTFLLVFLPVIPPTTAPVPPNKTPPVIARPKPPLTIVSPSSKSSNSNISSNFIIFSTNI